MEEHFEEIERWIAEDPPNTFGDFCGLKVGDFPPAAQLSEEDMMKAVFYSVVNLFSTKYILSFPLFFASISPLNLQLNFPFTRS